MNTLSLFLSTLFDHRTPLRAKALMWLGLIYGVSPLDLIPDIIPVLGLTDDAVILIVAVLTFWKWTEGIRKQKIAEVRDVIDV